MNNESQLEQLAEIRLMMERSSRFISLSGLSGIMAGIYAIAGAAYVWITPNTSYAQSLSLTDMARYVIVAAVVVGLSLITGFILTRKRAEHKGQQLNEKVALRMMVNLAIPMMAGGLFAIVLLVRGDLDLIAPVLLIFYGLGLINGGKYTLDDIRYLGISEVILGLICAVDPGNGLFYWTIGFGLLHIIYGSRMWWKYERSEANNN